MNSQPVKFTLRKAIASDFAFIWQLRVTTMKKAIALSYGWDEPTQQGYAAESLNGEIVLVEDERVGVVTIFDWGNQLHLTWIAVSPQYQGKGLGTQLIKYAQNQARKKNQPLTLQVLGINSAKLFYEKQGFQVYDRNGTEKLLMRWQPRELSEN